MQSNACLHQCSCGRKLPQMATASVCVPVASCLSGSLSKISKWVWPRVFSKYCLLCWNLKCVRFCVSPLRTETLCPTVLQLFCTQAVLVFKTRYSGGLSSQCWTPRLGILMWGLDHLLLGENLCHCDYPLICGSPSQGCGSWIYCVAASPPNSYGSFFIYLVLETLLCWSSDSSHW